LPNTNIKTINRRQKRFLYHLILLLAAGLAFTLFTSLIQPFFSFNMWLTDRLFVSQNVSPNVVVAGIDDATLQKYGKWSEWSRDLHAQAIDNLKKARAKVIGYDVLFLDNSAVDQEFSQSINTAGNVVLASAFSEPLYYTSSGIQGENAMLPVAVLRESANIGHVMIVPESDGTVRTVPLVISDSQGKQYPSFCLSMLSVLFNMPLSDKLEAESDSLGLFARQIPVDKVNRIRINFPREPENRTFISYADVISDDFDPALVKNKIVVIGMTASGDLDSWNVPTSFNKVPGVYIHAAVLDTILTGEYLSKIPNWVTVIVMAGITLVLALVLSRLKIKWGVVVVIGLVIVYLLIAFFLFDRGQILNLLYPLLLMSLLFIASMIMSISLEQSDKRFITNLFGRYVSPQVADNILNLADTGELRLGGQQKEVTILFADIRNYTRISEQMTPEAIVNMLNIYLSVMIERVLENEGMVNKFAGDNIMAVWNAPQSQSKHAFLAVKAAFEAQNIIANMQEKDPSLPRVQFGVGINTGIALAGNVGSSGRTEYTVIGDAVNLASRICSATPGGEVWIGPQVYQIIKDLITADELEPQSFKGKSEKITVFRLTGIK
jgi:adenylate cyclase